MDEKNPEIHNFKLIIHGEGRGNNGMNIRHIFATHALQVIRKKPCETCLASLEDLSFYLSRSLYAI